MSINFPTSLDTFTNPTATDYLNSPSHAAQHANANDAIEALQAKVGIDGSAVTSSHDYKLSPITGSDKVAGLAVANTFTALTKFQKGTKAGSEENVAEFETTDVSPVSLRFRTSTSATAAEQGFSIDAYESGVSDDRPLILQRYGGSVAINKAVPDSKLDVNGFVKAENLYTRTHTGVNNTSNTPIKTYGDTDVSGSGYYFSRITLYTNTSGTSSVSQYLVKWRNTAKNVYALLEGTDAQAPRLVNDGGTLKVRLNTATANYNVDVLHEVLINTVD
jgi:hypothetical protein